MLFEDPARRSTSLGVTVNPVRVPDIGSFGTLEAVGEKLLEAERKKVRRGGAEGRVQGAGARREGVQGRDGGKGQRAGAAG